MVFYQAPTVSLQTILKVFVVHGFLLCAFLFIAYKILKRDKKRLNIIISLFYITFASGLLVNIIYVPFSIDTYGDLVKVLYYITLSLLLLGTFYLTIFTLVLLKSDKVITNRRQYLMVLIYCIVDFGMILIPNGLTIDSTTSWNPVYSFEYFLYIMIIFTALSVVPQVYCFLKISNVFQQETLRKRWRFFMIGIILLYIFCYGTVIYNFLDIQELRTIWAYISIFLTISAAALIYYGVAKL